MWYQIVCLALLILVVQSGEHLYAHGPFGKAHLSVEKPNRIHCNPSIRFFSHAVHPASLVITELKVSATTYSNMEKVQLSWQPLSSPCNDDFIGVYFVETPEVIGACDYVDFEFVKVGQMNSLWRMINLRRQLEFRYYSRDAECTGKYTLIAKSPIVQPTSSFVPTQIHLAFANGDDQMYVSYVTNSSDVPPQCQYGLSPSALTSQATGISVTYKATDMCEAKANETGPQAFVDPGFMHTILLSGLRPSTNYFYRVGNDQHGWSGMNQFTSRAVGANEEVHFIAYGDMGVSPEQPGAAATIQRVYAKAIEKNITAILHIGDVSYARGTGVLWDAFMSEIEPTASRVPYMVGNGNHEYDHMTGGERDPSGAPPPGGFHPSWGDYGTDSGGECAVPLVHRFHTPSNGNGLFWYSFDFGPCHIVFFSTEHDFLPSSAQYAWLEKDLGSVSRSRTPWLIVGSHRPMYSSLVSSKVDSHRSNNSPSVGADTIKSKLQEYLEPLFYKHGVDLNLFAHIHAYERTCKMYKSTCVKDGITHALIGMAGFDLSQGTYAKADWSVYREHNNYGYVHIWANKTHLSYNHHHTSDGFLYDHFYLNK